MVLISNQGGLMKVCFTTYIYGVKYQNFIPWILYTVGKAYPEYYTIIFISGVVREDIMCQIEAIRVINRNFKIVEHTFDDCPEMNPIKAMSFRWFVWDDLFLQFDYLYYIDSDMFFIREPIPMHEQHIRHMVYIKSDCISNILRIRKLGLGFSSRYVSYYNLKYGGLKTLFRQAVTPFVYRMSGIHFVKVSTYFEYVTSKIREYYVARIYTGKALSLLAYYNDEHLLYEMLKNAGCDMSVFAIQQTSISMFGMNEPEKMEFCPHHGIHLGIFRVALEKLEDWAIAQLESKDYKYYIEQFKSKYLSDGLFKILLESSPFQIQETFHRLCKYYNIEYWFNI